MSLTDMDVERISSAVAAKLASAHPVKCLLFSEDEAEAMRSFARALISGRKTAWVTLVAILIAGFAGALFLGIKERLLR